MDFRNFATWLADLTMSGWWFGTCFIFPNGWDDDPIWRTHIFSGGRSTTN
jgi:hypothetical protein